MLGSSQIGERLEPVRIMRCTLGYRPVLHRVCNGACNRWIEEFPLVDRLAQRLVNFAGQRIFHHFIGENIASEQLCDLHGSLSLVFMGTRFLGIIAECPFSLQLYDFYGDKSNVCPHFYLHLVFRLDDISYK